MPEPRFPEPTVGEAGDRDPLEAGLAAAFGPDSGPPLPAGGSVLRALGASLPSLPQVHLREPGTEAITPVNLPGSADVPSAPDSSGRLHVFGEIARGGMGAVLKGRDTDLGRDVAVKVLLETHAGKTELVQRFVEEAQIAGQLQHPGIAPVYELGQFADKRPYFTMKLVKGKTLAKLLAERSDGRPGTGAPLQDLPRLLGIFTQVCQTLAYAHARGVIHRDLKPANVMVGSFGEVQVMDWGLAKVLLQGGIADEKQAQTQQAVSVIQTQRSTGAPEVGSHTQAGSVLGTPAYMAPEQARGAVDLVDARADVFGLGAILCEILTGQPPFTGKNAEAMRKAQSAQLADAFARLDACGADAELVGLARHCLAAEPWDRPQDAGEVVQQVTAYQNAVAERLRQAELARAAEEARALEARATAAQERKAREAAQARAAAERRARRLTVALAAAVLLLVVLGGGGSLWLHGQNAVRLAENNGAVKEALSQATELRDQSRRADNTPGLTLLERARDQALRAKTLVEKVAVDALWVAQTNELLAEVDAEADGRRQARSSHLRALNLVQLGKTDDALAEERKAIALDPNIAAAHSNIGKILLKKKKLDEALAASRKAAELKPDEAMVHWRIGFILWTQGKKAECVPEFRKVVELDPKLARGHNNLGLALDHQGKHGEAIACYRKAIELDPKEFRARASLGVALQREGKLDEAIACYRKAIAIAPRYYSARYNLGLALDKQGNADEAARQCHAVWWTRNPLQLQARSRLCVIRARQGRLEELRADWEKFFKLNPPDHDAWYGYAELCLFLGRADEYRRACTALLARFGQVKDPQIAERTSRACLLGPVSEEDFRRATALADRAAADTEHQFHAYFQAAKGLAEYRNNRPQQAIPWLRKAAPQTYRPTARLVLAMALHRSGQTEEARQTLAETVAGYHWNETRAAAVDDWIAFILLREAEGLIMPYLPKFLKGEYQPRDNLERLALIAACRCRSRYRDAARLYAAAFAADLKLADNSMPGQRYNAACYAALSAAGRGSDAAGLDDRERVRLRTQAFDWLRADLAAWTKRAAGDRPDERAKVRQTLKHWQQDADLAGIRDPDALAKLPAPERGACQQLWAQVAGVLQQAADKPR